MTTRRKSPRISLAQVFLAVTLGTAALVALLFYGFLDASRRSILDAADELRRSAARVVESQVNAELSRAQGTADDVERQIRAGLIDVDDAKSLERALFASLLDEPELSDATFTHAIATGYDERGDAVVAPQGRWQVSVYRAGAEGEPSHALYTRITEPATGGFVATLRRREPGAALREARPDETMRADDPTTHDTFKSSAAEDARGHAIWSDLHWSELGGTERRVVMTVQKAITSSDGKLLGVLRVGLLTEQIDRAARVHVGASDAPDPHRIFVCDPAGRLVTRANAGDALEVSGDDLRFPSTHAPEEVRRALESPLLKRIAAGDETSTGEILANGTKQLVTFRALAGTQDWVVGVVVPEHHYTAALEAVRARYLLLYLGVIAFVVVAGVLVLRAVRGGLRLIEDATSRMRRFDLAAASDDAPFREVQDVLDSLERAKTAMRTLGKYTPIDLVRELYAKNEEPKLGGALADVTLMFTDIEGFTSLSEKVTPDKLAEALGHYLETMTTAIRETGGTIDKFIGDAVMAIWNAPSPVADHATMGCRAALACVAATKTLFASKAWDGLPALFTRYGLHTDAVLVGHFGAPARMSYTALGDGVNLAARLEGLCKQYGVTILVSEAVASVAKNAFELRRIDRVAVKGKSNAVLVYELLGERGFVRPPAIDEYERALDDYFARRFDEAIARLSRNVDGDPPSRVLMERCKRLASMSPPLPSTWDGVFVATSK